MRKLGLRMYVDENNVLHVNIAEILEHFGWPDTEENRDKATALVVKAANEIFPEVKKEILGD